MEGDDRSRHVQMDREKELEYAVHKRDEVIQQLSVQLQHLTAHNYSEEAAQLAQQVQILQTQLQHAGKVLQSQTEKQTLTSHALKDATQEIVSLQQVITDKDSMMNQLVERLDLISEEYSKVKESHETTKIREKQTNEVVQKLMMDAELMRKQKSDVSNSRSMSGPSSPTHGVSPGMVSEMEVQAKMEALQSELEERYGLHFAEMKQAVVQQYQEEKVTLSAEMVQVRAAMEKAMKENADYRDQLQRYIITDDKIVQLQEECNVYKSQCDQLKELLEQYQAQNEDYSQRLQDYEIAATRVKELQEECALYKSQNDELKNKINSQQDSVVGLKSELDSLTSKNSRLRDQMNLLSEDLDSQNTEIEEAFLEKSQYIEKARKFEEEVGLLKSENEELKSKGSKMEDLISSLKEALNQSETSPQRLQSTLLGPRELGASMEVDGVTLGESTDETDNMRLVEEPSPPIDNVPLVQQSPLVVTLGETGTTESCVQNYGQSAMCVQEEVTIENATLAEKDLACDENSLLDTTSPGTSCVSLEQNLSKDTSNDSEATLTNDSSSAVVNESSQQDSVITQNQQYVSQIEALKADLARLLDERTFALSEIEKLSDEIMVLKEIGNKSEVELRELDHIKSENELFQKEREEQIESNLTLMADVQSANLIIETLQKELNQALDSKKSLEETSKEMNAKYEDVSMINQRLVAEMVSLRQDQSEMVSLGQDQSSSVLSPMEPTQRTGNTTSDTQQSHVTGSDSSSSPELGSGQSSHTDSENLSQLPSCQSSLDQGQLSQLDSNHLPQFDRSFFFGRQEEVPLQAQDQSADSSHVGKVDHSASKQIVQSDDGNVTNKLTNKGEKMTMGDNEERHTDLEQEILQMQTHVDDLHTVRANLLEHIEHLKKEAKTLEKSTRQVPQDPQTSAETMTPTENVTEISNTVLNELEEKNKTLQEEKDLLSRKISALEWQVTELKTESEKTTDRLTLPVEEVMVQKFMEIEEAVDGGSHDPWTQPTAERSLSSQDSIEQEIMVQDSQNSVAIKQEVAEDNITQTSFQKTCGAVSSSRMSPDSIDPLDNDEGTHDISADSIEEDECTLEGRLQERVRNSQCMLSVIPSLLVPSYSDGAGKSPCTKVNALDSASDDKGVDSFTTSDDPVDSNIGSVDHDEARMLGDHGDNVESRLSESVPLNNQGCDSASHKLAEHEDTSPDQAMLQPDYLVFQQKYTESKKDNEAITGENRSLKERLHVLSENCDSLRTKNVALSSGKEEDQLKLSSLQIECGALQEKVQQIQTENSDLVTKCEAQDKLQSELEKDNSSLGNQLLELKEKLDHSELKICSMSEVEDVLKSELETLKSEKVDILADQREKEAKLESMCNTIVKDQDEHQVHQCADGSKILCTAGDESVLQSQILQQQLQNSDTKYLQIDPEHDYKTLKEENRAFYREKEDLQLSLIQLQAQKENLERQLELSTSERQQMVTDFEAKIKVAQEDLVPSCIKEEDLTSFKSMCDKLKCEMKNLKEENTSLSTDNEKLQKELESKENERKKLTQSLEENKAKFIRNKAKLVKLEKTNTGKTKGDIQQLENLLKNKEDEKQELKDKMENVIVKMVNDNTTLKETLDLTMDKLRQENAESEQMKAIVEEIMKTNSELLEKNKNTNTDLESLNAERRLTENYIQKLEKQRATEKNELEELSCSLNKERCRVCELETQCQELKTTFEKEKEDLGMTEERYATSLQSYQDKINANKCDEQELIKELDKERTSAGMLEKQCKDLKTDLDNEKSHSGVLEKQCEDLKINLDKERTNAELIEKQCEDLKTDLDKERTNAELLEKQCEDLKTDLDKERTKAELIEKQCEDLKTDLDKERTNAELIEKQCEDLKTDLDKERSHSGVLEKQCEDLKTDLDKERTNAGISEKLCEDLKSDLNKEWSNSELLEKQYKDHKTDLDKERSNAEILEKQCEDLKTDLDNEKSHSEMLEKQGEDLKSNIASLHVQITELQNGHERVRTECSEREAQCHQLQEALKLERTAFDNEILSLKSLVTQERDNHSGREETFAQRFENVNKELETMRMKDRNYGELQVQCSQLEAILDALNQQADLDRESHEMEKSVMIHSMEQERTAFQSERLELASKCEKLQDSLTSVEQNLDSLNLEYQTKFHDHCLEKKELEKDIESQKSELEASFNKERTSLKEQCKQLQREKRMTEEGFAEQRDILWSEKQSLTDTWHQLSAGKEQLEIENQGLENKKQYLEGEIQRQADEIQRLECDKHFLLDEKQCFEEKIKTLDSELEQQRNQGYLAQEKFESTKQNWEMQIENLRTDLETEMEKFKNDKKELGHKFNQELDRIKTDKATVEQKTLDMEKSETVLHSELTQLKGKYSRLEESVLEMLMSHGDNSSQHDKDVNQLIMDHTEDLVQMKSQHAKEIVSMNEKCEKYMKDGESLLQERDNLTVKVGTLETEAERKGLKMEEEIRFLCGQVEELQCSSDERVRKHSEEKESLEELYKELKDEINIKQDEIEALGKALDSAKTDYEGLETVHQEAKQHSQVVRERLESTNRQNMALIENYKQCMKDSETELGVVHQQVEDSDQKNIETEKTIESFQEELTDLTESKDFYQAELESAKANLLLAGDVRLSLNTEIESLKSEVDNLTRNKHDLLSQVESLKNNMTENDNMSEDFLSDLRSLTAERGGEQAKNKELTSELKLRNERCEKLILAREQLLQELDASEQLRTRLENENENLKRRNQTLIQECAALKEQEQSLEQDPTQRESGTEQLAEGLDQLRNHSNELHLDKVNVLADQDQKSQTLEAKNESLVQEIAQLKETLSQLEQERDELLNSHTAMAEDLSQMQHKYETVQSLMEDTKKVCNNEIENLKEQLGNVNTEMTAVKSSLQLLEDDLNLSHDQKASLILRLTQEENRFPTTSLENTDHSKDSYKSQKDMRNQRVASGSQMSSTEIPGFTEGLDEEQDVVSESGFFQVEPVTEADTVTHYEKCINDLRKELEGARSENQQIQESYQEEVTKLYRKIEDLEKMKDNVNLEDQLFCENDASESSGLLSQEADVVGISSQQVGGPLPEDKEDEIESRVKECIAIQMEGMKYEMEEKVALQVRSKEAEISDKYDKEFKKYKKEMEVYMKHKIETIRAEKDTAFLKAMQKVNKDADKQVKKELDRQRLKFLEERANEAGDGNTSKVGSQIGEVVQKLHQENQDLAEARDALLQQVALSHHNQERLQEELRIMHGDDEDGIHGDFPDNIPGDSVVSEGGDYIQESDLDQSKFSTHLYGSTSLMFDWELSPQLSFDYSRDGSDALDFVEHYDCRRPRCRLIRQKFQELYDALPGSGSGSSVIEDPEEGQTGFKPDDIEVINSDSELNLGLQTQAKEGSFHPEENHASEDHADSFRDTEPSHKQSTSGFVAVIESGSKVHYSTTQSGFLPENKRDTIEDGFLQHDTENPVTEVNKVLTTGNEAGFEPEEGFEDVTENETNARLVARSEFLPEDDVVRIKGGEDMEDFIVDDVFESSIHKTMSLESESVPQLSKVKSDDKTLEDLNIVPEKVAICDIKPHTDADRFQPEIEFRVESSPSVQPMLGHEVKEGFTREADEFESEAGNGFKPEKDGFCLDQDLDGDMPITPTSELESELVREALRNAAQIVSVAHPYVQKKEKFMSAIPEKVDSRSVKIHKRSKSAPSVDVFVAESDETGVEIQSVDGVMMLKAESQEGLQSDLLYGSEPLQGLFHQSKQGNTTHNIPFNQESRSQAKTASQEETELEIIQRLRKDKKYLEEKVANLLSEKQSLTEKQRETMLQLENATLSRQHFEQELMGISDNFERLPVKVNEHSAKSTESQKKESEHKCEALQSEISSLEATLSDKEERLKNQRQSFEEQNKALLIKVKSLEDSLFSELTSSSKAKTDFEQEILMLRQRIGALSSVLEQDEGKIDLDKQVDSLESQVKELVLDKNQLQHRCKDLEGMLRETQMMALKEKTELDKELESIEGRTLILTSANQDLKAKCVELSNQQAYWTEEKKLLIEEKFLLKNHLDEILFDHQNLQTTCHDLEDLVQRSKDTSVTMERQLKILEDNLCEMTAAKEELYLRCMELKNRLQAHEGSSELTEVSGAHKMAKTERSGSIGISQGVLDEEHSTDISPKDYNAEARIEELEKHLKEKENFIHKLEDDMKQIVSSSGRQKDFMKVKAGLEQTLKEKDNYIRKLEEHFLRQGPLQIPASGPSIVPQETGSEDASSSGDSVIPQVMVENVEDHSPQGHSTLTSVGDDCSEHPSDIEMQMEDLVDHSVVSADDLSQISVGDMSELSTTSSVIHSVSQAQDRQSGSKQTLDQRPKPMAALSHSSPIVSPRIVSPRVPSTSSNTGSLNSSERLQAGFTTEDDGHLETQHSELVDEIARFRKDLSETKAIYTKENVLLKEALDKDGSSRDATKSKSSVSSTSFDSDSSHEVTRLRQKVGALEETNTMLQIENERWLRRIQDQEQVVIELRELLGRDVPNTDNTNTVFGKQITLLQNQRDHLLEKIHEFEMKNQRLTRKLGDNSILEESLRREKDLLYTKLCEREDLERELSEKRLALEKQRHSQEQLEEILYHKNITEKELMRQKRLLEEELSEIESKLQEKEELLERQKNTLLRDIKRRGSSPPKLLSGSFSVALNDDGSPASSSFYLEGTPATSTPKTKKSDTSATPRELGRLELQVQEAERQHASAIQNLRQSLSVDQEGHQTDTRQRYRGLVASLRTEHLHKVPET